MWRTCLPLMARAASDFKVSVLDNLIIRLLFLAVFESAAKACWITPGARFCILDKT